MSNNLPPYSVLVTDGDKSAVYHALNGFWVPTDQHPEPLLSAGAVDVTRIDIQSFNRFWAHSAELLAEQYPGFKAGMIPLEWLDHFTTTNKGKSDFVIARENIVAEMIEKYINAKFDVSKFDAVEVAECGVAAVATGPRYPGLVFERWDNSDDDTPFSGASIWTVYGHLKDGGVETLLDFDLETDADLAGEAVANIFGIDYGLGPKP